MAIKRAEEIMIPLDQYPHVAHWYTFRQAIAALRASQIEAQGRLSLPRAVLVFNKTYQLLGVVRRRDLLRGLEPAFLAGQAAEDERRLFEVKVDPNLSDFSSEKMVREIRARAERPVSDVLVPIVATVQSDDHIMKILHEMVKNDLSLIPVLKHGRVIGVVRSVELLNEISEIVLS
ncbi:MAG: CBS domain-containing protein [Candidatus Binataceae bacterium]